MEVPVGLLKHQAVAAAPTNCHVPHCRIPADRNGDKSGIFCLGGRCDPAVDGDPAT